MAAGRRGRRTERDQGPIIEITADLDAYGLEALQLEIRRLAARHGIGLRVLEVDPPPGPAAPSG